LCRQSAIHRLWRWMRRWKHSQSRLPRQAQVVELRYFGGLNDEEIAEALQTSPRAVRRDWDFAKSWLKRELSR